MLTTATQVAGQSPKALTYVGGWGQTNHIVAGERTGKEKLPEPDRKC